MDEALQLIIDRLIEIRDWYAENKDNLLSGNFHIMPMDAEFRHYYSDMIIFGRLLSNLATSVLKLLTGIEDMYDGTYRYLIGEEDISHIKEWIEIMKGMG